MPITSLSAAFTLSINLTKLDCNYSIETLIKAEAKRLGFALCGITTPNVDFAFEHFQAWIEREMYGEMTYLARPDSLAKRKDPELLLPNCKSVISLGLPYPQPSNTGNIAAFARVPDYHVVIRDKLKQLAGFIEKTLETELTWYAAVDSSPVLEKSLALKAGLGLIGKHTLLINQTFGTWFFLGELFLDIALLPDSPLSGNYCDACDLCVKACPTGALTGDKTMNASKCLSYLTIEHRGDIPSDVRQRMSGQVIGCDICQIVCPMNQRATPASTGYEWQSVLPANLNLEACLSLDEKAFKEMFAGTSVLRLKYKSFRRNLILALAVSGKPEALEALKDAMAEEQDPLCKETMLWGIKYLNQSL